MNNELIGSTYNTNISVHQSHDFDWQLINGSKPCYGDLVLEDKTFRYIENGSIYCSRSKLLDNNNRLLDPIRIHPICQNIVIKWILL